MNVTVIGAGAWGTALSNLLSQNGHAVTLWGHNPTHLARMKESGQNELYLPGVPVSQTLQFEPDLKKSVKAAAWAVIAVPSKYFREITRQLPDFRGVAVSVTKGIEYETCLTMSGILAATMPKSAAAVLSGPSLALEVARETPGAVVAAHHDPEISRQVQTLFHRPAFRVYRSQDVLGVELGGAIKNVVALAAGVCDGMGLGDNAKAGLITRGLAEMRRLGLACGANAETFSGLSGLGDLVATCHSQLSRNRSFGERAGRGEKIESILASTLTVAEGYPTARAAHRLARKLGINTPIVDEVHAMLYEGKEARRAFQDLMNRDTKQED